MFHFYETILRSRLLPSLSFLSIQLWGLINFQYHNSFLTSVSSKYGSYQSQRSAGGWVYLNKTDVHSIKYARQKTKNSCFKSQMAVIDMKNVHRYKSFAREKRRIRKQKSTMKWFKIISKKFRNQLT